MSAGDHYLGLLGKVLTGEAWGDPPLDPWHGVMKNEAGEVIPMPDKGILTGIIHIEPGAYNPGVRFEGVDWPMTALTMIGSRRLGMLWAISEQVIADGIPGDFLEAGVWRGGASIFMGALLFHVHEARDRTLWVADSFCGLPPPDPKVAQDAGDWHSQLPMLSVPEAEVRANFVRFGLEAELNAERIRFLPGWFKDTLPTIAKGRRFALLRVDADMYASTMDVLTSLYPDVSPGGAVIIDDYYAVRACQTAVKDFRASHGITDELIGVGTAAFWRKRA